MTRLGQFTDDELAAELAKRGGTDWRALADDLAAVLESLGGLRRPHAEPEVQRVLARWREARQR
jgi:hypothetical protein